MKNKITLSAAVEAERIKRELQEAELAKERAVRRKKIEEMVRAEQARQFSQRHRPDHE